jgi:hypothetical protein
MKCPGTVFAAYHNGLQAEAMARSLLWQSISQYPGKTLSP